jgi:hypothetical protein
VRGVTSLCKLTGGRCTCSVMLITRLTFKVGQINRFYHIGKTDRSPPPERTDGCEKCPLFEAHLEKTASVRKPLIDREPRHIRGGASWPILIQARIYSGPDLLRDLPAFADWKTANALGSGRNEVCYGGYWATCGTSRATAVRSAAIAGGLCGLFESSPRVVLFSGQRGSGRS